ncbi:CPBP family intramembrane metalloprotease [Aquincola sp. S2]|uniref:CPBP family intramembrane metalloprotease n=1 Tax=Pseudaquabacterium terrae TaxID=2732868 RepID=A0ABX2ELQ8_9BURK|nr:type II CAAX endopeptidase family protein [Aquabacterium terrae]NRF69502.1 CPBP family intramembrane metalloprotease [Aquabacterium terrae]
MKRSPFPGLAGALWLVLASMLLEALCAALLQGLPGLGAAEEAALARLVANAALFSGLVAFLRLNYRELFHDSPAGVGATLGLTLLPVLALVPGLVVVEGWISQWLTTLVPLSAWEARAFTEMSQPVPGMLVMVCVLAPVLEEMLFRGVILRAFLQRYSRGVAIAHSAGVFGLAHMNLYQFVAAFTLGLLAGWLYERTRSLWPCIALHAGYNTSITLLEAGAADHAPDLVPVAPLATALLSAWFLKRWLQPAGAR